MKLSQIYFEYLDYNYRTFLFIIILGELNKFVIQNKRVIQLIFAIHYRNIFYFIVKLGNVIYLPTIL